MPEFKIRKTQLIVEDISHDGGPELAEPRRRAACLAVVKNPFAGRFEADLEGAMEDLKPLGSLMANKLVEAMGGPDKVDAYGKGAIVGEAGEIEHGALWHVPGGYAMRGSHFDAMTLGLPDGPKRDEIVFVIAMAFGGRPHARMGGLAASDVKGEDGLR